MPYDGPLIPPMMEKAILEVHEVVLAESEDDDEQEDDDA